MPNTSADPIADTLDLLPAGAMEQHTAEPAHQTRPFGLTLAVPAPDAVELSPIMYDPQRQIATVGGTRAHAAGHDRHPYQTTVDHQRMTFRSLVRAIRM